MRNDDSAFAQIIGDILHGRAYLLHAGIPDCQNLAFVGGIPKESWQCHQNPIYRKSPGFINTLPDDPLLVVTSESPGIAVMGNPKMKAMKVIRQSEERDDVISQNGSRCLSWDSAASRAQGSKMTPETIEPSEKLEFRVGANRIRARQPAQKEHKDEEVRV